MKNLFCARYVGLVACLAFAAVPGCGGPSISVVPVSGKVTVDGHPVTAGNVSYVPVGKEGAPALSAGQIESDGSYTIHTGGKTGAPVGKYKVTVTPSMVPTPGATKMPEAPFNHKFRDPQQTPIAIEVTANAAAGAYDLKLTK
jgi:hypothetical protein